MTFYTAMPLELVLDGIQNDPGPFVEVTIKDVTLQVIPVAPGIGRIERILSAPLHYYLLSKYSPGQMICFHPSSEQANVPEYPEFGM